MCIKDANQVVLQAQLDKFYDSVNLQFKDRQHISTDSSDQRSYIAKMATNFRTSLIPDHATTIALFFYFSVFLKVRRRRNPEASSFQDMMKNVQGQSQNQNK